MKYFISICIVACCVVALISSPAFANEEHKGMGKSNCMTCMPAHGKMSHDKMGKMDMDDIFFHKAHLIMSKAAELALTGDQIEKIKTLKYSTEKSAIKEDADIKGLALDIKEALGKDEIDITAVNKLIDQKYTLKAQKTKESIGAYVSLKAILTPDQLKKLKDMHHEGMKKGSKAEEEHEEGE